MAITSGSVIQFEYMLGGGPPHIVHMGEQSDSTGWIRGAILACDTSGHLYSISTATITSATATFAVALQDSQAATADGSETAAAILITPQSVFSAVVAHATTANAVTGSTQIGNTYAITCSGTVNPASSDVWIMDVATSASVGGYVIGNKDASGTAYGRNYFIFCGAYATNSVWGYGTS
jgi:hypothetical protein